MHPYLLALCSTSEQNALIGRPGQLRILTYKQGVVLLFAVTSSFGADSVCPYSLIPAGTPWSCGGLPPQDLLPQGINRLGEWVGYRNTCIGETASGYVAIRWNADAGVTPLPVPAGTADSQAVGVNEVGTVVGWRASFQDEIGYRGCVWLESGLVEIPPFPGGLGSTFAFAVNGSNVVVGSRYVENVQSPTKSMGFVWVEGMIVDIDPEPLGSTRATARSVSESGVVVGFLGIETDASARAFRWYAGETELLTPLQGAVSSRAYHVNDAGFIAGSCRFVTSGQFAYRNDPTVWGPDGIPHSLPVLDNYSSGTALSVSDDGVVFGYMNQPTVAGLAQTRRAVWIDGDPHWISEILDTDNPAPYSACVAMNQLGQILTRGPSSPQGNGGWVLIPRPGSPADLNGDCVVNGADLDVLLKAWGQAGPITSTDLNEDGKVDGQDLGVLLVQWSGG